MDRTSFTAEFLFRASTNIIYKFLTTPDCLIRWFCDECRVVDGRYYFEWSGSEESAQVLEDIENQVLRLQWENYEDEYLEFKIESSPITNETILEITAFCDDDEVDTEKEIWASQMEDLRRATGE